MLQPLRNGTLSLPATESVDYAALGSSDARRQYYAANGYLVRPRLFDRDLCEKAITHFQREIKPYRGYLYRQASANPERNKFDFAGNVLNSLLNPLSVYGRSFPGFRAISEELLSQHSLFDAVSELYCEPPVLVQSMYFEANPATWPHQDCYYLDDDSPGRLMGAWIALEDIVEEAGRFYIAPGSHKLNIGRNVGDLSISKDHDAYKRLIMTTIESAAMELRAPVLRCGDVLFWNSRIIHGAFEPLDARITRNSYTAHFIPATSHLLQYQCITMKTNPDFNSGVAICRPKDQNRVRNRWMLTLESWLPTLFQKIKRQFIFWKIQRSQ